MNPITEAHLEGVEMFREKFDFAIRCNTGVADEVLAFLTTYAESILNAALEAGPREKHNLPVEIRTDDDLQGSQQMFPKGNVQEELGKLIENKTYERWIAQKTGEEDGHNSCRTSFHSAIDEGIEGIKKGDK